MVSGTCLVTRTPDWAHCFEPSCPGFDPGPEPIRAAMVGDPREYRWSSHHALAFGDVDTLLSPNLAYLGLSTDPSTRQDIYRAMVMATVDHEDVEAIRRNLQRQHAHGSDRFRHAIEAQLDRIMDRRRLVGR